jgi:glycosyltransferase involved in cell wall biosynthesis
VSSGRALHGANFDLRSSQLYLDTRRILGPDVIPTLAFITVLGKSMKKHDSSHLGQRSGLAQAAPEAASGNGNLTSDEIVGDAPGKQGPEPIQAAISVIIPAYNEEAAVTSQIMSIQEVLRSHGIEHEILVVDDGSEDKTGDKALAVGARVLRKPQNQGYGAALKTGIVAAEYDTIVMIDADGTYPPDQIPDLVNELQTADMVVGARTGNDVQIPWVRRPAKWLLGLLANRVSGQSIPDLNSGLRSFRRDCVRQYFSILSNKFSFTTTITLALLADDYRVVYHPINYYRRVGKSKITPRNFVDFTILVLRMAMLFQPLRIFVPLAFSCSLLGVLKAIADIVTVVSRSGGIGMSIFQQPIMSTSSVLLLLGGLHILLIGMVADGVLRRIGQGNRHMAPSHAVLSHEVRSNLDGQESDPESYKRQA